MRFLATYSRRDLGAKERSSDAFLYVVLSMP